MALTLDAVSVVVGKARLIERVSFSVTPGRLTVILGANGAGKSTALAVAAGDLRPTQGNASLDGRPLSSHGPLGLAKRRAVVLQHTAINFALSVHEVVALSRTPFGGTSSDGDGGEARALAALELLPLAGRDYSTLSGGERQRVQIARALAQLWHGADAHGPAIC
jgi:iron complex transport system ATP-binding protein